MLSLGTDLMVTPSPRGRKAQGVSGMPLPRWAAEWGTFPLGSIPGENRPAQASIHVSIHPFQKT